MILSINLKDEPLFLEEIKKFIMENVKGIARSEFEKQIKQIFAEKLQSAMPNNSSLLQTLEKMSKDEIQKLIKEALVGGSYGSGKDEMRKIIREEIAKQVKEMFDKKDY